MFTCQGRLVWVAAAAGPAPARGSRSLETPARGLRRRARGSGPATLAPENPLAVSPAAPLGPPRGRIGVRRYSRHVPTNPPSGSRSAPRIFWARSLVVVAFLSPGVAGPPTMRALAGGGAKPDSLARR